MKESISYTYLLNMMLVFIVISFCVIMAVISYTKAYRINSKMASALEEAEGYNDLSKAEIARLITSFGYQQTNVTCKDRNFTITTTNAEGAKLSTTKPIKAQEGTRGYCVYEVVDGDYYYYGITTYMMFDFPIINLIKLPVFNETEKIYNFPISSSEV